MPPATENAASPSRSTEANRNRLLEILVRTSFNAVEEPVYKLASGLMSRYYVDCRMALSHPEARLLVGEIIAERIAGMTIDAVGGMAVGAYPIANAVSDAIYRNQGLSVPAFLVRKEPKKHGLQKWIEGDVAGCRRVLIVDDVVTTGQSTVQAIDKSREAGLEVANAIVLVDRDEEGGRANIERTGVNFEALFSLRDLREWKRTH